MRTGLKFIKTDLSLLLQITSSVKVKIWVGRESDGHWKEPTLVIQIAGWGDFSPKNEKQHVKKAVLMVAQSSSQGIVVC